MALRELHHVIADHVEVATGETIKEGQVVSLNLSGEVVLQGADEPVAYGLAGDTKATDASSMPGVEAGWQNRVSDYYDETKASGRMTVYHSGGRFASDQFASNVASSVPGDTLYAFDGVLDTNNTQSGPVALVIKAAGAFPSGVPGTDINGDIQVSGENNDTYVEFKLLI